MKVNREQLISKINDKWKSKECQLCKANNWEIANDLVTLVGVSEHRSIQLGGQFMPLVSMVCRECGNTLLINPLVLGCVEELEN